MPEAALKAVAHFARAQMDAAIWPDSPPDFAFVIAGKTTGFWVPNGSALPSWLAASVALPQPAPIAIVHRLLCRVGPHCMPPQQDMLLAGQLSDQQVEAALAQVGLQGRFNWEYLTCDIYDPALRRGIRLQGDAHLAPIWEPTAPLANFMGWVARADGFGMVHAATLGAHGTGCLILGEGGRGKSGTTLGGILHGLQTVGDDYVLISRDSPPAALPVYRSMKQDDAGLRRCGLDPARFGPLNWADKRVFPIETVHPLAMQPQLDIKAILLPQITGKPQTQILPAPPSAAFMAIMPSTLGQLSGERAARFGETAQLARALPCFHLHLGVDPAEVAGVIQNFLAAL